MEKKKLKKLVVFDVEGVLIPKARFIFFRVSSVMGMKSFILNIFFGLLYEIHAISLKKALRHVYGNLRGLPLTKFIQLFSSLNLMPGTEKLFKELNKRGYRTALISSGIPTIALEKLGNKLEIDYAQGLEMEVSQGLLTGKIWGNVIEKGGKALALKKIVENEELSSYHIVCIADDKNNLSMFKLCETKIGYNPDFALSCSSDYVFKGELSKMVPLILGDVVEYTETSRTFSSTNILRKTIHISGFLVPLFCFYLDSCRYLFILSILAVTCLYIGAETGRMFGKTTKLFTGITKKAAGTSEFQGFVTAPIFFALGIVTSLILFPKPARFVSITVLTLGDGFAAIFGEKFGTSQVPFNKVKSYEGLVCGFFFALLGSLFFVNPLLAFIASAFGMVAEILPSPINDNLMVPLVSGFSIMLASTFQ